MGHAAYYGELTVGMVLRVHVLMNRDGRAPNQSHVGVGAFSTPTAVAQDLELMLAVALHALHVAPVLYNVTWAFG